MKKTGFTLAEILISLMILGVIASLTIPSLIQNTNKKDEQVKLKKAVSMINQAIAMDKGLTGNDLSQYRISDLVDVFNKRMSVVKNYDNPEAYAFVTQDGLSYVYGTNMGGYLPYDPSLPTDSSNFAFRATIFTKPINEETDWLNSAISDEVCTSAQSEIKNCYRVYCSYDNCVPSEYTAKFMNATDPTKAE